MKELPIAPGNLIQDNNFLQASKAHKDRVFDMLRTQKRISFRGGLESGLIDNHFVDAVSSLRIESLWLACDTDSALPDFKIACQKLVRAGFKRKQIHCYALIGDDMEKNENRLREIYRAGATPFAQLYRDFSEKKTRYSKDWNAFARIWQRPPLTIAHMEAVEKKELVLCWKHTYKTQNIQRKRLGNGWSFPLLPRNLPRYLK